MYINTMKITIFLYENTGSEELPDMEIAKPV